MHLIESPSLKEKINFNKERMNTLKLIALVFGFTSILSNELNGQVNAHLPLKSFAFDFVFVEQKDFTDSAYSQTGIFIGTGEINIHSDSIVINWSNEWECGTYRFFVDTAMYQQYQYDNRKEWLSHYFVRTKGYHDVDGMLTLVEGNDLETGSYIDVVLDTRFTLEGWARQRRRYVDIKEIWKN